VNDTLRTPLRRMSVLILEDTPTDAQLVERELRRAFPGAEVRTAASRDAFTALLSSWQPDIILSDYLLPDIDGMAALEIARHLAPDVPVIIVTGSINEETAVDCIKAGAADYVIKEHLARLNPAVRGALERRRMREERERIRRELRQSEEMCKLVIENAADFISVLTPEGGVSCTSASFRDLLGKVELAKGQDLFSMVHEDDRPRVRMMLRALLETRSGMRTEYRVRFRDGSIRVFDSAATPICEGDQVRNIIVISRDVTERSREERERMLVLEKTRQAMNSTVSVIARIVEARDPYTAGHQRRCAALAAVLGNSLKLDPHAVDGLYFAAIIHDVGKVYIPSEILSKPGLLTDLEFTMVRTHAKLGYDILKDIEFAWPIADIVYQHHERMDGSGYPRGITGDALLLESRILAVADVVEAMASHRPYRPALGLERALEEIVAHRGTKYDPEVVDACVRAVREYQFRFGE